MGVHRGPALIPQHRLQAGGLLHPAGKGPVQLRPGALCPVHIPGKAHHQLVHLIGLDQLDQLLQHHLRLPAVDGGHIPRQKSGGVGDRHPGVGVAVVNGHDPHTSASSLLLSAITIQETAANYKRLRGKESPSFQGVGHPEHQVLVGAVHQMGIDPPRGGWGGVAQGLPDVEQGGP